MIKDKTTFKN
jgi:protein JBTS26